MNEVENHKLMAFMKLGTILPEEKLKSSIGEEGSPRLDKNSFNWSSLSFNKKKSNKVMIN